MIQRSQSEAAIATGLNEFPVTILLGPRQCGKTTLARDFAATHTGETTFWDLENPNDRARLASPMLASNDCGDWSCSTKFSECRNCSKCCAFWPTGVR